MKTIRISSSDTLNLRNEILRPGKPLSDCRIEGDDAPDTRHFGALDSDNTIVGIVSLYRKEFPGIAGADSYQLRGMATSPVCRGKGVGRLLLTCAENYALSAGADKIWANARSSAIGFYTNYGYLVVSDEFDIDGIGPHFLVIKSLV